MDREKAKLIVDKIEEIKEIVKTEPNNDYFVMYFCGDYTAFNNDPHKSNYYSFILKGDKITQAAG